MRQVAVFESTRELQLNLLTVHPRWGTNLTDWCKCIPQFGIGLRSQSVIPNTGHYL